MWTELPGSYPLPNEPTLAAAAAAVRDTGQWAFVVDDRWNLVYVSDELRLTFGAGELADFVLDSPWFGSENLAEAKAWPFGANTDKLWRTTFSRLVPFMLADMSGDRDEVRSVSDPLFHDLIEDVTASTQDVAGFIGGGTGLSSVVEVPMIYVRLRTPTGDLAGSLIISKPAPGMNTIASLTSAGDLGHLEQMASVARADRRPAAILFADLEASSQLARRLPTSTYFALGRRLVSAADRAVIDAGGLVGRHVGDGVVAFFVAENLGSESDAAFACITAARALRSVVDEVAERSGLEPEDVILKFGMHWGSTLYMGNITTAGRTEVTALGDEVNECARIEACATGGRALASKDLIERLTPDSAFELDIDPASMSYTTLNDLPDATEKARRDAPAIAVCEV